ncbi:MAG: PA2779 family protein [Kiloniellales bacterium]
MAKNDPKRAVAAAMALLMAMTSMPIGVAQAEMVTTDQVIEQVNPPEDRTRVMDFMLRDDVQQQLTILGVDPEEAARRVASLSDEEIQQIAGRLEEMPAGEGGVGPIVGAILIIFLVLLVTDLLGLTDVFPFVKKKSE